MSKLKELLNLLEAKEITDFEASNVDPDTHLGDIPILKELLKHVGVPFIKDLKVIHSVDDEEEIWEPNKYFTKKKDWKEVSIDNFTWGYVALGYIKIKGKTVPAFYDQNAAPVGFYVNRKAL